MAKKKLSESWSSEEAATAAIQIFINSLAISLVDELPRDEIQTVLQAYTLSRLRGDVPLSDEPYVGELPPEIAELLAIFEHVFLTALALQELKDPSWDQSWTPLTYGRG